MKRDGITSLHGIHGYRHRTKPEKIRGRMINYSENRVWSPPRLISKYAPAFERPLPGVCQEIDGGGEWRRILECCCLENCFFFFFWLSPIFNVKFGCRIIRFSYGSKVDENALKLKFTGFCH